MPSFTLLTMNCYGVPTPMTRRRLLTLARALNDHHATVVCLQEVQAHLWRRLLTQACSAYPSHAFEPFVHAPKGGLMTFSRMSLGPASFTLYEDRGQWYTPAIADMALHKGVLRTELTIEGTPVVVLNTHLTANYRGDWKNENRYVRTERSQLKQLAEVAAAEPPEALVIACGDFNFPRGCSLYTEFLAESGFTDPLAGDTRPTFRPPPGLPERYALPLDFTFLRAPQLPGLRVTNDIRFHERVPFIDGGKGYLSDHMAIELELSWDGNGKSLL